MRPFPRSPSITPTTSRKASPLFMKSANRISKETNTQAEACATQNVQRWHRLQPVCFSLNTQQIGPHRHLVQSRNREAVPIQLALVMSTIGREVGVRLKVDDAPNASGLKSQIDDTIQNLRLVQFEHD